MKAVIVECSNGAAVALCDDGTFRKLKNRNYSIGQELVLKKRRSANRAAQKLSICASLALFLLSFVGFESYSYIKPYSYVSLDINPSIEYSLNRYDKVISVAGINDDGQQVVSSIESDIKNQNITTALGVTLKQLERDHYISQEEDNHVIISVCSNNDTKARSIASRVDSFSETESQMCSIDTVTVSQETKENADSLGITPGKLVLIKAVAETTSESDFDVSQWTDKTVSELETTIQANSQSPDGNADPDTNTVIDSEYLSSVLDESTADISDSTATASATEADPEGSSASTDKTTNNAATVADSSSPASSATQDGSTSTTDNGPAATSDGNSTSKTDENTSSGKPGNTAAGSSTGTNTAGDKEPADSSSTGKNTSGKDTSDSQSAGSSADTSKKPSDSNSSSKQPAAESPDSGAMSEESSSKKDSYPADGTESADTEEPEPDKTGDASNPETGTDQAVEDSSGAPGQEPQTVE